MKWKRNDRLVCTNKESKHYGRIVYYYASFSSTKKQSICSVSFQDTDSIFNHGPTIIDDKDYRAYKRYARNVPEL